MVFFGFSTSLTTAIVARFATGVFSGVVMAAKVMLSEVQSQVLSPVSCFYPYSCDLAQLCPVRLQATASSFLTVAWGLGLVVGSSGGGLLAEPADKYALFATEFWRTYPYLLPCALTSGLCALVLVPAYLYLPETLPPAQSSTETEESLLHSTDPASKPGSQLNLNGSRQETVRLSAWQLLQVADVRFLVLLYGIFSFAAIGMEEMHALFCATPVELGGLGWSTSEIGTNLGAVGLMLTLLQTLTFPVVERRFKLVGAAAVGAVAAAMCTVAYPMVNTIAQRNIALSGLPSSHSDSSGVWLLITAVATTYKVTAGWVFCSITLMFNNSVYPINRSEPWSKVLHVQSVGLETPCGLLVSPRVCLCLHGTLLSS
jgi:hypothetical protein